MKKIFLFVLLFQLSSQAWALQIQDPDGIADRIQHGMNSIPFEQAFQCGEQVHYRTHVPQCNVQCLAQHCMSQCTSTSGELITLQVEECSSDRVMIYGTNGLTVEVLKSDYEKFGGVWYSFYQAFASFITPMPEVVRLTNTMPLSRYTVVEFGKKRMFFATMIEADGVFSPQVATYGLFMDIDPNGKGLRQILSLRSDVVPGIQEFYGYMTRVGAYYEFPGQK